MRKLLISAAAAAAAAVVAAAPASAQGYYGHGYNQGYGYGYQGNRGLAQRFDSQIAQLQNRIERSAHRRVISPGEYRALSNRSLRLRQRLQRFAYDGLSRGEVHDIAARIDNLRQRIRDERRDGRRGYGGYGW